tara:strand:- start:15501 stop:17120 length:1620 start_codon:yes stop_codon:yes gene_type:complete
MLILVPICLATQRLILVTGTNPYDWTKSLSENYISQNVLEFTLLQSFSSTILTLIISIPIAWTLGRHRWPFESLIRTVLTLPFVIPSIIAAMGILTLVGSHGLDLRTNEGTWWWTLIISHAWFNMALIIRFCEPLLSKLDPDLEEQLRLLPHGRTRASRIKNLWAPLLLPSIVAAACMTFVFSFTSFALVRWITVRDNTLESMMAEVSSSAGIQGYMEPTSDIVMGASLIQFTILLASLWLTSVIQRDRKAILPQARPEHVRKPNSRGWLVILPALIFAVLPLISVVIGSFRIRELGESGGGFRWGTDGWNQAYHGSFSFAPMSEAILNSLGYAAITILVALPLGYALASTINDLEKRRPNLARLLDVFTMLPFALSAAMVGLGVLLGIIKLDVSSAYQFWALPSLAHIMLTTPFVVRIMLPALRSLDNSYDENARVLGMDEFSRFIKIKIPLLKGSIIISSIFVIAMSLGEFGASFIVAKNSDWTTMPLLIDAWRAKPMKDPLSAPASNAVATVLMVITMGLFMFAERFRNNRDGGMF